VGGRAPDEKKMEKRWPPDLEARRDSRLKQKKRPKGRRGFVSRQYRG